MSDNAIGDIAPDFELPTDGDAPFRLADQRGKFVVLYFYPKDDTPGCTTEAIAFTRLAVEFAAANAVVLGVSPDSVDKHCKFKDKYELSITLGADEDKEVVQAYGVWVQKKNYGREYMGVERTTFLIDPEGKIAKVWHKVKVEGHAEAVLESVKAAA